MDARKKKITLALLVVTFLAAFEGTVVATASATIVKDLQGLELVSWIFSLYLLTSAISTPIYGKLADLYGRKYILSIGILIFLAGSLCCGLSQSMGQLVAFRAVQGIGAGAIFTVTFTIVGDVFPLKERSIVQGLMSSVWGIAGLVGPLLGGFLIDTLSWHWIFFINLPFGLLSIVLLKTNLDNTVKEGPVSIDYTGTLTLSAAIAAFLYGIMIGYENGTLGFSLIASCAFLALFVRVEKRVAEPIVPLSLLTKASGVINGVSFFVCMVLISTEVYMPLYIQSVLGYGATVSGLSLATMSIAWMASSVNVARLMEKFGPRAVVMGAAASLVGSAALLGTLTPTSSLFAVSFYSFLFGFGFSGTLNTLTFMVQDSVGYEKRGAAVGLNSLTRTLAQSVGVSLFGTVINLRLADYFRVRGLPGVDIGSLYQSGLAIEQIKDALFSSLHFVFLCFVLTAAFAFILAFLLPRRVDPRKKNAHAPIKKSAACDS